MAAPAILIPMIPIPLKPRPEQLTARILPEQTTILTILPIRQRPEPPILPENLKSLNNLTVLNSLKVLNNLTVLNNLKALNNLMGLKGLTGLKSLKNPKNLKKPKNRRSPLSSPIV